MSVKKARKEAKSGLYELLQIDTASSTTKLLKSISPAERSLTATMFRDFFQACYVKEGGKLHGVWKGDGGTAIFVSTTVGQIGSSVRAARRVLKYLPTHNAKVAKVLHINSFPREVRISAHRGEIFRSGDDDGVDAGLPEHFTDFLKFERKFAPNINQIYVTNELFSQLPQAEQRKFEFCKKIKAGSISTSIYRPRNNPNLHLIDLPKMGVNVASLKAKDWEYLTTQIHAHYVNVSARNQITKGLISYLTDPRRRTEPRKISSVIIRELTLDALAGYLRIAFPKRRIHLSYWRPVSASIIAMVSYRYPDGETTNLSKRRVKLEDLRYKVCECFHDMAPVVTPSVNAARLRGNWHDFDNSQKSQKRGLLSALQVPIYYERNNKIKEVKGVLSFDANEANIFKPEEIDLWRDELIGYLANLSLSECL